MKKILKTFGLFIALSVVFSGLSACSNTANSQKGPVDEKTETNSTNAAANASNVSTAGKSADYPPLPAKLAQSNIELADGTVGKIEDRKGKVLLLNLWGIWCAPCRKEMPHLIEIEEKFKDKGFQIVGLNVGDEDGNPEDFEKMKNFAQQMNLNYELARISEDTTGEFFRVSKFGGVPQSFLIDREGHLRGVFVGGSQKVIDQMKENVEKVVNE